MRKRPSDTKNVTEKYVTVAHHTQLSVSREYSSNNGGHLLQHILG